MSDVASTVKEILGRMPSNLDAAQGMRANIQLVLTGEGAGNYCMEVNDGACKVVEGMNTSPNLTVTMPGADWVDLVEGRLHGMTAFMTGRLKVSGDMALAMKLQSFFRR